MNSHLLPRLALALVALAGAVPGQLDRPDPTYSTTTWNGVPVVAGRFLVTYAPGVDRAAQLALESSLGSARLAELDDDLALLSLPPGRALVPVLAELGGRAEVAVAEPDVLMQPTGLTDDPKWGNNKQWGLDKVNAQQAFVSARGSADVVIAIIDSGVLTTHTDLAGDYAWGLDTYANDANPADADGHGTHCAGVAAASTDNGLGMAGAGFDCRFAAYRCGNASFPTSALVAAIDDAVDQGAQVLSMSWGSSYNNYAIRNALQDARDAGCLLVAAAGNDGVDSKFYPAGLGFVLAVASSAPNDGKSSFSNYGSWVDVAAPGQSIHSTYKNGGYVNMSGTSMACPLVAGLGGLLYAQLGGQRSTAAATAVREAIEAGVVPVGNWVEHGRVDFPAALAQLSAAEPQLTSLEPATSSPLPGQELSLHGSGLLGVDEVRVAGQPAESVTILGDEQLVFTLPDLPDLGSLPVTVVEDGDVSTALTLEVAPADPPELHHADQLSPGDALELGFAGQPGHGCYLLVAASPTTFVLGGRELLLEHVAVFLGLLDAQGLKTLETIVPASIAGVTVHLQHVTVQAGLSGASPVGSLAIGS